MDLATIQATVTSLKAAFDIAKGISDVKTIAEVQAKVIELQQIILTAQESALKANADQFDLVIELKKAKEELEKTNNWLEEKNRYVLYKGKGVSGGVVYGLLKNKAKEGEPPHFLCPECYESGKKSILMNSGNERAGLTKWICNKCKLEIPTGFRGNVGAEYVECSE